MKTTTYLALLLLAPVARADDARTVISATIDEVMGVLRDDALSRGEKNELLQGLFEDFPGLVGLILEQGEREIGAAFNTSALETGRLTGDEVPRTPPTSRIFG